MPGTHVRRRPHHAATGWRLAPPPSRRPLRAWLAITALGLLVVLAAVGPLLVSR
ncbi:MAG: hypothetical protein ACT4RN_15330 [Pseudonocardia sp.]